MEPQRPVCYRTDMPKKDFTQVAFDVVQRATGEAPRPAPAPMKKAAPPVKKVAAKKPAVKRAKA